MLSLNVNQGASKRFTRGKNNPSNSEAIPARLRQQLHVHRHQIGSVKHRMRK